RIMPVEPYFARSGTALNKSGFTGSPHIPVAVLNDAVSRQTSRIWNGILKQCPWARPYAEMLRPPMRSYPAMTAFSIADRTNPHVFRKPVNALSPNHFSIRSFHTDQPFFGSEPDFSVFSGCKTANSLRGIGQWMIRPDEIDFLRIEFEPVQPLV